MNTADDRSPAADDGERDARDWGDVTRLIGELKQGRLGAFDELLPIVYAELRARARGYLNRQSADHTLDPTALVHETYLRIAQHVRGDVEQGPDWRDRAHFFAVAATAMRQILVDHARHKGRDKRGGGQRRIPLADDLISTGDPDIGVVDLDTALTRLSTHDARLARVVELRFFAGLTIEECAQVLAVAPATIKRDWVFARTWLLRELKRDAAD